MGRLDGKVVIVTGGTKGMGAAEVRGLVKEGARLALGGRDGETGRAIEAELKNSALFVPMDVGIEADWQRLVATTLDRFGRLTSLVNNAGVQLSGAIENLQVSEMDACYRVNQLGPLLGIKHCVGPMRRVGGGSIVNIGSVAAVKAHLQLSGYSGTKAAIVGITKACALELAADNIRGNAVHPGFFATTMLDTSGGSGARDLGVRLTPLKRSAAPVEIVGAIVYLLSDESGFVTGTQFCVDGGYTV